MKNTLQLTWHHKWEQIITFFFTTVIALLSSEVEIWLRIAGGVFAVFLIYDVSHFAWQIWKEQRIKQLPLFAAIGVSDDELLSMTREVMETMTQWKFDLKRYEQDYGLDRLRLYIHRESDLPQVSTHWKTEVDRFAHRLIRIEYDLPGQKVLHIFLNCPTALAVGLGAVVGTRYNVVLYQKPQGGGKYVPVVTFDTAPVSTLRDPLSEPFEYIHIVEPALWKPTLFVALQLGKASMGKLVAEMAQKENATVAVIENLYDGQLQSSEQWISVAREVRTQMERWLNHPDVKRVEIFLGGTVMLYFLIGMALGNFRPITVHQWFGHDVYKAILELNQLKRVG